MNEDDSEKLMTMGDYHEAARQQARKELQWKMKDCTKHPERYFVISVKARRGRKPNYKYYHQISIFSKSWMPANMITLMDECGKKGMKAIEARKILQNAEDIYLNFKNYEDNEDYEEIEKKLRIQFPIETWFNYPCVTSELIRHERSLLKNNIREKGKKIIVPVSDILTEGMDAPEEKKDGSIEVSQSFQNRCIHYFYQQGQRFLYIGKQTVTKTDRKGQKIRVERIVAYGEVDLKDWSKLQTPLIARYQVKKIKKRKSRLHVNPPFHAPQISNEIV